MGAYLTTTFAMVPLIFAGAGMLKGFAIITIITSYVITLAIRTNYIVLYSIT